QTAPRADARSAPRAAPSRPHRTHGILRPRTRSRKSTAVPPSPLSRSDAAKTNGRVQTRPWNPSTGPASEALAAQQFADRDPFDVKGLAQDRHARIRVGLAAHEHVKRSISRLRPGVD